LQRRTTDCTRLFTQQGKVFLEYHKSVILQNVRVDDFLEKVASILEVTFYRKDVTVLRAMQHCCASHLLTLQPAERLDVILVHGEHNHKKVTLQCDSSEQATSHTPASTALFPSTSPSKQYALPFNGALSHPLDELSLQKYASRKKDYARAPQGFLTYSPSKGIHPFPADSKRHSRRLEVVQIDDCERQLVVDAYERAIVIIEIDGSTE
jgi:hypothetical protein